MRSQVIGCLAPMRAGARGWGWFNKAVKKMNTPAAPIKSYDFAVPAPEEPRPRAFFNVQIGAADPERIVLEIASDITPKTAQNFLQLCSGDNNHNLTYKNTRVHQIQKNCFVSAGDVIKGDGTGGQSVFGEHFEDENFALRFTEPGVLGMANAGVDSNGSQFFITLQPMPQLNGRNVAFGKIVEGMEVMRKIENVYCVKGKPLTDVQLVDCGLL